MDPKPIAEAREGDYVIVELRGVLATSPPTYRREQVRKATPKQVMVGDTYYGRDGLARTRGSRKSLVDPTKEYLKNLEECERRAREEAAERKRREGERDRHNKEVLAKLLAWLTTASVEQIEQCFSQDELVEAGERAIRAGFIK